MTRNEEKLAVWNRMTPEQRDYDRFVARRIPYGASWKPETPEGLCMSREERRTNPDCCSCHIFPPCSYCVNSANGDDETDEQEENANMDKPREMRSAADIVRDALLGEIRCLLAQCSQAQRDLFARLFPEGIENVPESSLRNAVGLCQRTVRKNIEDPSRLDSASQPSSGGAK